MIRDRQPESAPVVQGTATDLPFRDGVFDAGVAILAVHHWPDQARGLTELARLAVNRIVILTSDLAALNFWLIDDYFPGIADIDLQIMPSIETFRQMFNLSRSCQFLCLTIASTDSWEHIGGVPTPTWTLTPEARSRPFPRFPTQIWSLELRAFAATLRMEHGSEGPDICCVCLSLILAIAW